MSQVPELSVIIPVFNEEGNLQLLYDRLSSALEKYKGSREFIFINDGSKDTSLAFIKYLAEQHEEVRYFSFSRNFGHQIAAYVGLEKSRGRRIALIDADLQDPPELIPTMMDKMDEGFEVVYAKREVRKKESFFKKITAKVFYRLLAKITEIDIPLDTGDFRVVDRKIVEVLKHMPEQQKFLRGQISWAGFRQTYITYTRDERHSGKTGYPFSKMLRFALDGITSFSNTPLKMASVMGYVVSILAFLYLIYAVYAKLVMDDVQDGWTSVIIAITFLGGIQLICLGVIGEYLGRIASNVRNRPLYIIQESSDEEEDKED